MRAGDLRHRITIQRKQVTYDAWNQPVETWVDFATVWASIEPVSGREFWAAKAVNAEVTHKVRMRYLQGVTPQMRILYGARVFEILSVLNVQERNVELELLCKEVL